MTSSRRRVKLDKEKDVRGSRRALKPPPVDFSTCSKSDELGENEAGNYRTAHLNVFVSLLWI